MITVTCATLEKSGQILLARPAADQILHGKWEFPEGKVEDGDSPEESLKWELVEELGIQDGAGEVIHEVYRCGQIRKAPFLPNTAAASPDGGGGLRTHRFSPGVL
jgi:8-oxo-dGTP pyrophosphatase MutT (NUDIX family)